MAYLLGVDGERLAGERTPSGGLVESFVAMEILERAAWSATRPALFHFREAGGQEVDFVLEDRRGRLAGIEVKWRATVSADDFRWLRPLRDAAGARPHPPGTRREPRLPAAIRQPRSTPEAPRHRS